MSFKKLVISQMGGGVIEELLSEELKAVLANIGDPNTKAQVPRVIEMKIKFKPAEDRSLATVQVETKSKLAPIRPYETITVLSTDGKTVSAFENDLTQPELPEFEKELMFKKEANQ